MQRVQRPRVNEEITAPQVRVVEADGKMIGIMSIDEALQLAEDRGLDLVEVAPQANPPVCKIMDFGKYQYELQKREKLKRRQQQQQQLKELRFKINTDKHDFDFKVRHAREFLEAGHRVKATVIFRGREMLHQDSGVELLQRFVDAVSDIAKVEHPIKSEKRHMYVILVPESKKSGKRKEKAQ